MKTQPKTARAGVRNDVLGALGALLFAALTLGLIAAGVYLTLLP